MNIVHGTGHGSLRTEATEKLAGE